MSVVPVAPDGTPDELLSLFFEFDSAASGSAEEVFVRAVFESAPEGSTDDTFPVDESEVGDPEPPWN